jgi:hypothetical protein
MRNNKIFNRMIIIKIFFKTNIAIKRDMNKMRICKLKSINKKVFRRNIDYKLYRINWSITAYQI